MDSYHSTFPHGNKNKNNATFWIAHIPFLVHIAPAAISGLNRFLIFLPISTGKWYPQSFGSKFLLYKEIPFRITKFNLWFNMSWSNQLLVASEIFLTMLYSGLLCPIKVSFLPYQKKYWSIHPQKIETTTCYTIFCVWMYNIYILRSENLIFLG